MQTYVQKKNRAKKEIIYSIFSLCIYLYIYIYIYSQTSALFFLNRDALFHLSPVNLQVEDEEEAFLPPFTACHLSRRWGEGHGRGGCCCVAPTNKGNPGMRGVLAGYQSKC